MEDANPVGQEPPLVPSCLFFRDTEKALKKQDAFDLLQVGMILKPTSNGFRG